MQFFISFILFIFCSAPISAGPNFLTLSDIHYGPDNPASDRSDTGEQLWLTTLTKFKQLSAGTDFIILLGDLPEHDVAFTADKKDSEARVFHDLFKENTTNKPMFYVAGNNDSLLGNYQPFSGNGKSPLDNAPDWEGGACAHCEGLIIDNSLMHEKGYYSSYVMPGNKDVVLIALNATQFTHMPWWAHPYPNQDEDARQQLEWLEKQLQQISSKQLLIAMHEEPGFDYQNKSVWHKEYLERFIQLLDIAQARNQQISLLAAHSHYDELRKISLSNGHSIYSYSTPSISRGHNNNSGMKVFYLSQDGYMKDFTTYYTTSNEQWNNDHYHAINPDKNNIFSSCAEKNLADCLDSLTPREFCDLWNTKMIYGVKNARVKVNNCQNNFPLNTGQ